jgi:DNA invertase Pin-like site-specific DNA recombinase
MNALDRTFLDPVTWPGLDFPDLLDRKAWGKSSQTPVTWPPLVSQFTRHIEASRRLQNFDTNVEQPVGMKYAYARISTTDKDASEQLDALRADGCDNENIFKDTNIDATAKTRPALLRCLKTLQAGDTLTVWKLDRLARGIRDLVNIGKDLQKRGIALRSLTEKIDTSVPGGELAFQYFAAVAEFERNLTIERRNAGLQAARARGLKTGPMPTLTPKKIEHARKLIAQGAQREDVARSLGVGRTTLWRALSTAHPAG